MLIMLTDPAGLHTFHIMTRKKIGNGGKYNQRKRNTLCYQLTSLEERAGILTSLDGPQFPIIHLQDFHMTLHGHRLTGIPFRDSYDTSY